MKYIAVVVSGLVAISCADPSTGIGFEQGDPLPEETTATEGTTGTVRQKAQFADDTILNIVGYVGAPTPLIHVTADFDPVTINIFYVGDKTFADGSRTPMAPQLVSTLSLAANQTKTHTVNTSHPAFSANHSCLVVEAIDGTGPDKFQTHVQFGQDTWSVGGSVFTGGSYRIPYGSGITQMFLAITNQGDFAFPVTINRVGGIEQKTVNLAPLSTYRFDSAALGWAALSGPGSVQVTASNGGVIAVSGYNTTGTSAKYRFYPVKAAPFP